jgi:hypothetical protein
VAHFTNVVYTRHAIDRMQQRRISKEEVEAVLRFGEGYLDDDEFWVFEMESLHDRRLRVIVTESGDDARVVTVMRLRRAT